VGRVGLALQVRDAIVARKGTKAAVKGFTAQHHYLAGVARGEIVVKPKAKRKASEAAAKRASNNDKIAELQAKLDALNA